MSIIDKALAALTPVSRRQAANNNKLNGRFRR
jgi:hypothetical protein